MSHPFSLRVFVLYDGQDFKVMPGGLAWVRQTDQKSTDSSGKMIGGQWVEVDSPAGSGTLRCWMRVISCSMP